MSKNMAALYEQTRAFIHSIAWKYRGWAELEDLEQEGYLGLCDAVDRYDPDAGVLFLTYANHWIRQKIARYCQNCGTLVRIPVGERELLRKYKKLESVFLTQIGRRPSDAEIRRYMGITQRTLDGLRKAAQMGQLEALDAFLLEDDGATLGDTIDAGVDVEGRGVARGDLVPGGSPGRSAFCRNPCQIPGAGDGQGDRGPDGDRRAARFPDRKGSAAGVAQERASAAAFPSGCAGQRGLFRWRGDVSAYLDEQHGTGGHAIIKSVSNVYHEQKQKSRKALS